MIHRIFQSPRSTRSKAAASVVVILLITAGFVWRSERQKHPRWSTMQPGKGGVFSVATGFDSSGKEIVVAGGYKMYGKGAVSSMVTCQEIKSGKVRWEILRPAVHEESDSGANVAIGPQGGIFVSWGSAASESPSKTEISRLSDLDGSTLWTWSHEDIGDRWNRYQSEPFVSPDGTVWVTWQSRSKRSRNSKINDITNLATIDPRTGREIWSVLIDRRNGQKGWGRGSHWLPRIRFLDDNSAILAFSPLHLAAADESWWLQRISPSNGEILWQSRIDRTHEWERWHEWGNRILQFHLDEDNGRLIVICRPDKRNESVRFSSFDLDTGKKIWEQHTIMQEPLITRLSKNGDIDYWKESSRKIEKISWDDWGKRYGLPWPNRVSVIQEGIEHTILSGANGTILASEYDYSGTDLHSIALRNAGTSTTEIYQTSSSHPRPLGCSIWSGTDWVFLDARRWFKNPDPWPQKALEYRVVKSPSGRQILVRNTWKQYSQFTDHRWEIQAWW